MDLQIKTHEIFGKKKKKRFSNPLRQKTLKTFFDPHERSGVI